MLSLIIISVKRGLIVVFFFIFKPRCELHAYVLLHRNFQTQDVDFYFTQRLTRTNKIVKSY